MGFNSAGAAAAATSLRRLRDCIAVPVGVNIGKNRDTPVDEAVGDYRTCLGAVHDIADYIVVNLSSPNTPGLRDLQAARAAGALVGELVAERERLAAEYVEKTHVPPLFVKIAPDLAPADLQATVVAALQAGADGFVATNTTVSRPASLRSGKATEEGGLSGRPLFPLALEAVRRTRDAVGEGPVIVGVGGIANAADANGNVRGWCGPRSVVFGAGIRRSGAGASYRGWIIAAVLCNLARSRGAKANSPVGESAAVSFYFR